MKKAILIIVMCLISVFAYTQNNISKTKRPPSVEVYVGDFESNKITVEQAKRIDTVFGRNRVTGELYKVRLYDLLVIPQKGDPYNARFHTCKIMNISNLKPNSKIYISNISFWYEGEWLKSQNKLVLEIVDK